MNKLEIGLSLLVTGAIAAGLLDVRIGPEAATRTVRAPIPGCEVLTVEVALAPGDDSVRVYPALAGCPTGPDPNEVLAKLTAVVYAEDRIVMCSGACDTVPGWEGEP